jgi:hypothetical protein
MPQPELMAPVVGLERHGTMRRRAGLVIRLTAGEQERQRGLAGKFPTSGITALPSIWAMDTFSGPRSPTA